MQAGVCRLSAGSQAYRGAHAIDFFALRLDLGSTKDLGNNLWFECQSFLFGGILMPARVVLCPGYWMAGTTTFGSINHFFLHPPILSSYSYSPKATQPLLRLFDV